MESALPPLIVPIHQRNTDAVVVMTGRTPTGQRVGIAFTDVEHLVSAMGRSQAWMHLSETGLRGMLAPLGFRRIQVDPLFVGPEVPTAPVIPTEPHTSRSAGRQRAGKSRRSRPAVSVGTPSVRR